MEREGKMPDDDQRSVARIPALKGRVKGLADQGTLNRIQREIDVNVVMTRIGDARLARRLAKARSAMAQRERVVIQRQCRSSLLAYGFLRGKPYRLMELITRDGNDPRWRDVESLIRKYGGEAYADARIVAQQITEWKNTPPPVIERISVLGDALALDVLWRDGPTMGRSERFDPSAALGNQRRVTQAGASSNGATAALMVTPTEGRDFVMEVPASRIYRWARHAERALNDVKF